MFGTFRDKASAKQATSTHAEFTGVNLLVPWGASLGHLILPPFCRG